MCIRPGEQAEYKKYYWHVHTHSSARVTLLPIFHDPIGSVDNIRDVLRPYTSSTRNEQSIQYDTLARCSILETLWRNFPHTSVFFSGRLGEARKKSVPKYLATVVDVLARKQGLLESALKHFSCFLFFSDRVELRAHSSWSTHSNTFVLWLTLHRAPTSTNYCKTEKQPFLYESLHELCFLFFPAQKLFQLWQSVSSSSFRWKGGFKTGSLCCFCKTFSVVEIFAPSQLAPLKWFLPCCKNYHFTKLLKPGEQSK